MTTTTRTRRDLLRTGAAALAGAAGASLATPAAALGADGETMHVGDSLSGSTVTTPSVTTGCAFRATSGDPSAVALHPIIKFPSLFGRLAVEMDVANSAIQLSVAVVFLLIALVFIYRSFYIMRIAS